MQVQYTNYRIPGDTRRHTVRFKCNGWKFSISLHPYLFYFRREWREFRLTLLGINLHFRRAEMPSYG